jgi:hypothetical protein
VKARNGVAVTLVAAFALLALMAPGKSQAAFGIQPGSFSATASGAAGAPDLQAGSHPYEYTVSFTFNPNPENNPSQQPQSVLVDLPPGLVGDPLAIPRCPTATLDGTGSLCPGDTQIGIARGFFSGGETLVQPIYNLAPVFGSPARLGFSIEGNNSYQEPELRSDDDYGLTVADFTIPVVELEQLTETIWGAPADPSHDAERQCINSIGRAFFGCASDVAPVPFLTLPTSCSAPLKTTVRASSIGEPDVYDTETYESQREGAPAALTGCHALPFEPTIASRPTTNAVESPTGLDFDLHQPQALSTPEGESGKSCTHGEWEGEPSEFSVQWLRNGVAIPGATTSDYTPTNADSGTVLQCEVTATNPAVAGAGHAASAPVTLPPEPAVSSPEAGFPYVSVEAELATCVNEGWGGNPTFTYRWFKDGALISGQDGETIPVPAGSAPFTLQCEVLGTNAGGTVVRFTEVVTSAPPLEPAPPASVGRPTIAPLPLQLPLAAAALKDAVASLPQGMTLNPSAANGLAGCFEAKIGRLSGPGVHFSKTPQTCPNAAKIGSVEVKTPLIDHTLDGSVYVAQPFQNPFGSLLAIYLAIEDEQTGTFVKLAGKVIPDPLTGQLTATFTENPQLPIEDIDLHFFSGERAVLTSPLTCGTKTTTSTLTPWSTPEGADAHPTDSFQVSGSCAASESAAPKAFSFTAGTASPLSGTYSPFVLRVARPDGSQHITGIDTTLPAGLLGKLAGVTYCPESDIAQAKSREVPEKGKLEQQSSSCPQSSQVGTVNVTAGSGSNPIPVSGHAYLAGPYKGAPLSLVVIVPAVAGPFDLGTVVDRVALNVGEYDARIHAVADPLPTIREGIPLDVRSIELKLDRPSFTLNPTSCEAAAIEGSVSTQAGQSQSLNNRFQVGECGRLAFKPSLALSLKGQTKRTGHPALKAVVTYPKGGAYANIAKAQVSLPHSEFLDQGNLNKVCKQAELSAGTCPKRAIYGKVKAWTPLLEKPLEGNVYLGVGFGYKLPALVAELDGQVRILLKGKVDTDKQKGIRSTFEAVPDAPIERFVLELKGGKEYGLLENSENVCRKTQKVGAVFRAQNGKVLQLSSKIANSCGKGKAKRKGHKNGPKKKAAGEQ